LSVKVNAPRGRGPVQIKLTGPFAEHFKKVKQSAPYQALVGLELAVNCQRADPFDGPRCSVLQGFRGGERCAPAPLILQESELPQFEASPLEAPQPWDSRITAHGGLRHDNFDLHRHTQVRERALGVILRK